MADFKQIIAMDTYRRSFPPSQPPHTGCKHRPTASGAGPLVSRLNHGHRIRIGDYDMRKAQTPSDGND